MHKKKKAKAHAKHQAAPRPAHTKTKERPDQDIVPGGPAGALDQDGGGDPHDKQLDDLEQIKPDLDDK